MMTEDRTDPRYAKLEHSDYRCGARWGGANTSHCTSCHRTFTAVGTFDAHRQRGKCLDPVGLGMVLAGSRIYEAWGFPMQDELPLAWR